MTTSSREPASAGGRDHRNHWPASIGTGGRLCSESAADFVGMRRKRAGDWHDHAPSYINSFTVFRSSISSASSWSGLLISLSFRLKSN